MAQGALLTYLEENVICGAHVHIRLHKHTYGFPMHPDNLIHSVAARLDILNHSTKLSLHGTCLNLFPVWLVGKSGLPSSFHRT